MRIIGVVQARLGSTRFPRKILQPIATEGEHDVSMLSFLLSRLTRSHYLDRIIVAVPPADFEEIAAADVIPDPDPVPIGLMAPVCHESDLIARHVLVAREHDADLIVRVPSDNPFVDPCWVDIAIQAAIGGRHGLVDTLTLDYPARIGLGGDAIDGLGAEVYSRALLEAMHHDGRGMREHPRDLARNFAHPPSMFGVLGLDWRHGPMRFDVDEPHHLERLRRIVRHLPPHFNARMLNDLPDEYLR